MKIILIDNYDSFTYNLVQYLGELGHVPEVYRNDKITVDEVKAQKPAGIVISPGPGNPDQAGISLDLVHMAITNNIPLLGICLGHQTIGQACGGTVVRAPEGIHGKLSAINHNGTALFTDIPSPYQATRYHSLIVDRVTLPDTLEITAETEDGLIMGLSHKTAPVHGIQYHPESIATEYGHVLLNNFIKTI